MHLLVAFASGRSEACAEALSSLALPRTSALLAKLEPVARDDGDDDSLSPPHERALAAARGWRGGDGALPFAAHAARGDGIDVGSAAWGLVVPAHWQIGRERIVLADPALLALSAAESEALHDAVAPLFASVGFRVARGAPLAWYVARDDLDGFATASPDRAIGTPIDVWFGRHDIASQAASATIRRLQSEAQMLLYTHLVNDAREARGALPVNAFWLWGCGRAQATDAANEPLVDDRLRAPFLGGDWAAWCDAWAAIDAGPVAALHDALGDGVEVALTLCGERSAVRYATRERRGWRRVLGALGGARVDATRVLATL